MNGRILVLAFLIQLVRAAESAASFINSGDDVEVEVV